METESTTQVQSNGTAPIRPEQVVMTAEEYQALMAARQENGLAKLFRPETAAKVGDAAGHAAGVAVASGLAAGTSLLKGFLRGLGGG